MYAYTANNPINFVDPSGHAFETFVDLASIAYSSYDLIRNPSAKNAFFLLWDVGAAVVPFVPGSYVAKGIKATSKGLKNTSRSKRLGIKIASSNNDFNKGRYVAGSYRALRKTLKGKSRVNSIEIHHIIEKRFCKGAYLKSSYKNKSDSWLSIPMSHGIHKKITKDFRKAYKYKRGRSPGHYNLGKNEMRSIVKKAYKNYPSIKEIALKEIDLMYLNKPTRSSKKLR